MKYLKFPLSSLILILLNLWSPLLFANIEQQISTTSCPTKSEGFSFIYFNNTSEDCIFLTQVTSHINSGLKLIKNQPKVGLVISEKSTNAGFDNGHLVLISKNLYSFAENRKSIQATPAEIGAVLLHEYGHSILNLRLKKEFNKKLNFLFDDFENVSSNTIINILNKKPSLSTRKFGEHLTMTREFKFYAENIASLSELYADLFAVLATNNLDIMVESLNFAKNSPDEVSRMNLRSFSRQHQVSEIAYHGDVHSEYSLVRSFLGKLLKDGVSLNNKKILLQTVEDQIIHFIIADMTHSNQFSIQEKNDLFINKLKDSIRHLNE